MAICRSSLLYKYLRNAKYTSQLLVLSVKQDSCIERNFSSIFATSSVFNVKPAEPAGKGKVGLDPQHTRHFAVSSSNKSETNATDDAKGKSSGKGTGKSLLQLNPNDFVDFLKEKQINRCYVAYDNRDGKVKVSHPELEEFAQFVENDKIDFDQHEGVFLQVGRRSGCLMGVFVWRINRGQAVS